MEPNKISELIIARKDIDFSAKTVALLKRNLLSQLDSTAKALCESPIALRSALENGLVKLGSYTSNTGDNWVYINLNNHNYVIPYIRHQH